MNDSSLIVFLKYPEKGKVKTRLAKDLSESFATEFYKLCVEKMIEDFKTELLSKTDIYIFCLNNTEIESTKMWIGNGFNYRSQSGNNLGMRIQNAFAEVFNLGYKKAVIVGTDIPDLNSEIINTAFNKLNNFDSVLGPSTDGGYYLLGIRKNHPELFEEITWSTNQVFSATLKRLNNLKLSNYQVEKLIDIDTADDLIKWLNSKKNNSDLPLVKFIKRYQLNAQKNML